MNLRQIHREHLKIGDFLRQFLGNSLRNKIQVGCLPHFPSFRKSSISGKAVRFKGLGHEPKKIIISCRRKLGKLFCLKSAVRNQEQIFVSEGTLSEIQYLHWTSGALPFDVEGTGFEISGLHKAAMLRPAFYKAFPNFKS